MSITPGSFRHNLLSCSWHRQSSRLLNRAQAASRDLQPSQQVAPPPTHGQRPPSRHLPSTVVLFHRQNSSRQTQTEAVRPGEPFAIRDSAQRRHVVVMQTSPRGTPSYPAKVESSRVEPSSKCCIALLVGAKGRSMIHGSIIACPSLSKALPQWPVCSALH